MKEKISVIIPCYNSKTFLVQAVQSALQQPETGEVLIVDDASTDGSASLGQSLAGQDPRIRYIRQPYNAGAGAARNRGIGEAVFPWISFLDADDFFLPDRFAPLTQTLQEDPLLDGAYDAITHHFEPSDGWSGRQLSAIGEIPADISAFHAVPPENLFHALLFQPRFWIPMVGFTVRKSFLDTHQLRFDPSLRYTEDTDFIYRCVLKGRFRGSGATQALVVRRLHSANSVFDHPAIWHQQRALFFRKWRQEVLVQDWPPAINRYFVKSWLQYHPLVVPVLGIAPLRLALKLLLLVLLFLRYPKFLARCSFIPSQK